MNTQANGRAQGAERSSRENVIYFQDRIFLAVLSKHPQQEIDYLFAQLKRYTGA